MKYFFKILIFLPFYDKIYSCIWIEYFFSQKIIDLVDDGLKNSFNNLNDLFGRYEY